MFGHRSLFHVTEIYDIHIMKGDISMCLSLDSCTDTKYTAIAKIQTVSVSLDSKMEILIW